ncbi:hypothetical protein F5X97DRAFT_316826 [Nemania serpens]|nr:hypothetical protein F5X97DRAFT_316826 [Nemania serpens]
MNLSFVSITTALPPAEKTDKDQARDKKDEQIQERWRAGIEAKLEWPEIRFPVVIRGDTYLSSPEQLQIMLGLPSVPRTSTTVIPNLETPRTSSEIEAEPETEAQPEEEAVICDVNLDQITRIEQGWVSEEIVVMFENEERFALVVLAERKLNKEKEEAKQ